MKHLQVLGFAVLLAAGIAACSSSGSSKPAQVSANPVLQVNYSAADVCSKLAAEFTRRASQFVESPAGSGCTFTNGTQGIVTGLMGVSTITVSEDLPTTAKILLVGFYTKQQLAAVDSEIAAALLRS